MERLKRASNNQGQDQYVLTVFLPLLAVAILACAGGCCYMERRRRKRKLKYGGVDPEEIRQQQDFDDSASVISAASSRKRHYLNPTQTTGRLVRGASVRSNYSTFGEPLYEAQKRERNRKINSERNQENDFDNNGHRNNGRARNENRNEYSPSSRPSSGYGGRPLSRSRSMVDVRNSDQRDSGGLRRSRSSNNLDRYRNPTTNVGYPDNQSTESETENPYEFLNGKAGLAPKENNSNIRYNRPPSPAQSEWSVRTAPPRTGYEDHNMKGLSSRPSSRPSSMVDFPLPGGARERRGLSRMRSMSQPDLQAIASKTYPQGILKKEDGRYPGMSNQTSNSSDSGIKDIYGEIGDVTGRASRLNHHQTLPNMMDDMSHLRPSSRPPSVMSYGSHANRRQPNYDPYFTPRYTGYAGGNMQQSSGYHEPSIYSITGSGYPHQQTNGYQPQPVQDTYGHTNYDPYGGYNSYWDQRSHQGHRYRSSMY